MTEALFQVCPPLDAATEAALRASIERFGVLVPVALDQYGNVLDGHHRRRIAAALGVSWREDVHVVGDDDEARAIAVTLNADRRQLDPSQRREVVALLREQGHSQPAIADALGVSQSTVRDDIKKEELSRGTKLAPERTVGKDGKFRPSKRRTVVAAKNPRESKRAQDALADLDPVDVPARPLDTKRVERIAREKNAERRRAEPIAETEKVDAIEIRHGDLASSLDDLAGSVDAIITDPPYPGEFVETFSTLSAVAARLLKPGGVLVAMTGQTHLPEYIERLSEHLTYRWCGAYLIEGPRNRVHARKVGTGWKPLLVFGAVPDAWLLDDVFVSTGDDKEHHYWGQNETGMAQIVDRFTDPGQLVVDPFLGGGTTAVVCRELGRRFVGCDIDAAAVATARERIT